MPEIVLPHQWEPRSYQLPVWRYFAPPGERKRGVCVWHRRAGKDLVAVNLIAVKAMQRVGVYWHLLPTYKQGRAIVWNGFTRDGRRFLDHFPKGLVEKTNDTEMRVHFKNGSIYQVVGTDNIDLLVGTNPVGCVFSEYSLHDPGAWDYIRPILSENGGWALFIYTPRGHNHGWRLLKAAERNPDWFCERLKAGSDGTRREDGTPVISDAQIAAERRDGMDERLIDQEFFVSFDAPLVGAFYGDQMAYLERNGRFCSVPHDPLIPVDTAWDIGVGDATAIWFIQVYGTEVRLIDYYESSGEGMPHYARQLWEKPYNYGRHYAPHDIEVREFTTGRSRIETARSLGIKFYTVKKHAIEDGIEAVRQVLPMCWIDKDKCARGIECLNSYRKEFDEKNQTYRSQPLHDWASHGADAFRMFAMGRKLKPKAQEAPQERAEDDFDYLRMTG